MQTVIEPIGVCLKVQERYKTRYWCWAYTNESVAQHVKEKIIQRWNECPVQKLEDLVNVFVLDLALVKSTNITVDQMQEDWINTHARKVNLKEVSGYLNEK